MSNIYYAQGDTLAHQYRNVGKLFATTINKSVRKIEKSKAKQLKIRRNVAESAWNNIRRNQECREFIDCLKAWSEGAGITPVQAMWLLADNLSGCQTMLVRYESGVALLHTEEEFRDAKHVELHMTSPHTIAFGQSGERIMTLVYNNLLPGSGLFGWQRDKIVAVDSIFLKEDGIEEVKKPLLANVVAWMMWRMSPEEASPARIMELVKRLGTLIDGYAINVIRKVGSEIQGYKLILARDEYRVEYLGNENGDTLVQVNIIEPSKSPMRWTLPPKNIWRGGYKYFMGRLKTLKLHTREYVEFTQYELSEDNLDSVHHKIQAMIFSTLASDYVSDDLGAMCVGFVDSNTGTSVSSKLNDGKDVAVVEYIDRMKL